MTTSQQRWVYGLASLFSLILCVLLGWFYIAVFNQFAEMPNGWRAVFFIILYSSGMLFGGSLFMFVSVGRPHTQIMLRLFTVSLSLGNIAALIPNTYTHYAGSRVLRQQITDGEKSSRSNLRKNNLQIWMAGAGFFPVACPYDLSYPREMDGVCFGSQLEGNIFPAVNKALNPTGQTPIWKMSPNPKAPSDFRSGSDETQIKTGYGIDPPVHYRIEYGERDSKASSLMLWRDKNGYQSKGEMTERENWLRHQAFHRYVLFIPQEANPATP